MRLFTLGVCLAFTALTMSGCGRPMVTALTQVNQDGSWKRTLEFSYQYDGPHGHLEGIFVLPEGNGWKTKTKKWKDGFTYTAERILTKGEKLSDIVIKGEGEGEKKGKPKEETPTKLLVNEVTVQEIAPGKLLYRETLRWQGKRPKLDPWLIKVVKNCLSDSVATDADVEDLAKVVQREVAIMFFGPKDPLFPQFCAHPEIAKRRLKRQLTQTVANAIQNKFGEKMPAEKRLEIAHRVAAFMDGMLAYPDMGLGIEDSQLIPLSFVVMMPGKIVSANGKVDGNEVTWALFSDAVAFSDLVLEAICELR